MGMRDWWCDRTRPARFLPSRPATKFAQHTIRRRFGSFFVRWANLFAHRTQPRGDIETNNTSATADVGQRETAVKSCGVV